MFCNKKFRKGEKIYKIGYAHEKGNWKLDGCSKCWDKYYGEK